MKKKLMMILLTCAVMVPAVAQGIQDTGNSPDAEKSQILIYKLNGKIDTLLLNNVRDIYHSCRDINGVEQTEIATLRLRTIDGETVYPLTEIEHVAMPKFGRIFSFSGTTQAEQATAARGPLKTAIDSNIDVLSATTFNYEWVRGDHIYLPFGENGLQSYDINTNDAGKNTGRFSFRSDSIVADQYVVYYPGTNSSKFNQVVIPTSQTQTAANNSTHIGKSGDCATAIATRQANSNYSFALDHKTAVLCFLPRVDTLKTLVLKEVRIQAPADKKIAGTFTLSPEGVTLDTGYESSNVITLTTSNFAVPNNKVKEEGWEKTPQDSVASYIVVAPQTAKTSFNVYYRVYDTHSKKEVVVEKASSLKPEGGRLYPITHKLDPRLFFAVLTDSAQWTFGKPATLYGSVNLPIKKVGIKWGYDKEHLDYDLPDLTCNSQLVFNTTPIDNVLQRAYYYQAYAKDGKEPETTWLGKIEKFGMEREIINLGTSVRWSSINMGAITAEDPGKYYAWGELSPKENYTLDNYQYYENDSRTYRVLPADFSGNPAYDVVAKEWRGCWRMPTKSELDELYNTSKVSRTDNYTLEGRTGRLFSNKNGNADSTMFVPNAGFYNGTTLSNENYPFNWSVTSYDNSRAWYGHTSSTNWGSGEKWHGMTIRPVFESNHRTKQGEYLFIRTDSISFSNDHTSTYLYGTMRGLDDLVTNITQGFIIGETENVTLENAISLTMPMAGLATDNGSYRFELTTADMNNLTLGRNYFVRSYITYNDSTFYGNTLEMDALQLTTDSTNWQVGMKRARLCGTVSGITESSKEHVTIGFVLGTTMDVNLSDAAQHVEVNPADIANGKFTCELQEDIELKQYYYRAYIMAPGRGVYYANAQMLGLEMVDLGLPSGLLWANINMGAQTPNDNGDYYAWAETSTRETLHNASNYQYYNGGNYLPDPGTDFSADPYYDAAQQNWKSVWRMPSKADVDELLTYCTIEKNTTFGVEGITKKGYKLTGPNGKSIFLPAAGWMGNGTTIQQNDTRPIYWASSTDNATSQNAFAIDNFNNMANGLSISTTNHFRYEGYPIRPVAKYSSIVEEDQMIRLTTDSVTWEAGQTEATLHGYLIGEVHNQQATESGFIYATTENVTDATAGREYLHFDTGRQTQKVASGPMRITLGNISDGTVYYYRAYVKIGDRYYYGEEREFGRRMVDLGLPSGLLWSNINLGGSSPDESGNYYAWGETSPRSNFSNDNYQYHGNMTDISGSSHDAAHVTWQGNWRMPTLADLEELLSQCTWTEVTKYGQPMYKVTANDGSDSIFIAKRGYMSNISVTDEGNRASLWTSTLNTQQNTSNANAYASDFIGVTRNIGSMSRYLGYTIRPVVKTNRELADGTKFYLTTDSTNWQVGVSDVRLYGSVTGLEGKENVTHGFVVGLKSKIADTETPDLTDEEVTVINTGITLTDNSFSGNTTYTTDTTYYYRAYVKVGDEIIYGNARRYGLSLVNMGDGIKWASLNLGAQISSDYGERYAWADTITKGTYSLQSCRYYDSSTGKYETLVADISNKRPYDAAKWQWGGTWRMPTLAEFTTLLAHSTWEWTEEDGQPGYRVTSTVAGFEGNSIFLPAAGYQENTFYQDTDAKCYYWTSSLYDNATGQSYYFHGEQTGDNAHITDMLQRYYGLSIRPVTTAGTDEGGGGDITGGHQSGHSQQTGNDGNGGGNAGTGNTGGTIGD